MRKTEENYGFKLGKYKITNHNTRRQGEMVKRKKKSIFRHLPIAIALILAVGVLLMTLMSGLGLNALTTYNRKFFNRGLCAEPAKHTPYKSMVVLETNSGRVLAGYHENERLPMASTTKIMTAIVAIEELKDMSLEFEVPSCAVGVEGSSMYLKSGERLSIKEYLYGLMLPSGNDSAVAIANIVSGSEQQFAELMNIYAKRMGLSNTNFVTASGLHDENHFTTSLDLAKITAYALKNEVFREIVSTPIVTVRGADAEHPRILKNKQKLLRDDSLKEMGISVSGVKTGFTPEAGRCLVTSASGAGMDVVAVVLNAPDMFETSASILKEVFTEYKMVDILSPKQHISKIGVANGETKELNLYSEQGFRYPLTQEERVATRVKYNYPKQLSAPVKKEEVVGEVVIELNGQQLFKTAIRSIEESREEGIRVIINKLIEKF